MKEEKRKGARSIKEIPKHILKDLNLGKIETVNLVEWLAVDRKMLLKNLLNEFDRTKYLKPILVKIDSLKKQTVNTLNEAIGEGLFEETSLCGDESFLEDISKHRADIVRSWTAYAVGKNTKLSIKQMLQKIKPFAKDSHYSVREEAWLSVRKSISENIHESILILSEWAKDKDENIRRFASEATRPRGVWCKHIEELKENPSLALPILDALKSDSSKYVRDSVGNWLNDASKTKPEFVNDVCLCFKKESGTKETEYIIKKALRTINK